MVKIHPQQEAPQQREKMTLMLTPDLRHLIEAERRKIELQTGWRVSRTQIVESIVLRALSACSTEQDKDSVAPA